MAADYAALTTEWNTLTGTTAQRLTALNALTVTGPAQKALLTPSQIINAVVPADLAALTTAQVSILTLVLQGSTVDGSVGTTVRAAVQNIFAGKTQTLSNLGALVTPFDSPQISWWQAHGFGGPITLMDLEAAQTVEWQLVYDCIFPALRK